MAAETDDPWFPPSRDRSGSAGEPVPVGDQPQANVIVRAGGFGRAEDRPDEFVVEIRRPQRELGLL